MPDTNANQPSSDATQPNPSDQLKATQLLSQIPFGALIGTPLKAAVDAQAASAVACVDFVRKVGFDDNGTVRNVTLTVSRSNPGPRALTAGGAQVPAAAESMKITVPLLTIMPIPFIRIEDMTLAFKAQLSATTESSKSEQTTTEGSASLKGSVGWAIFKCEFSGGFSSKKDSKATSSSKYCVEYTIDVNVHAVQDDMPAGMAKLLGILTDGIRMEAKAA